MSTQQQTDVSMDFYDNYQSPLPAGSYRLVLQQTVIEGGKEHHYYRDQPFVVQAPRYTVEGSEIQAYFPPPGGVADYQNGKFDEAIARWKQLLALLPPDATVAQSVKNQIARAEAERDGREPPAMIAGGGEVAAASAASAPAPANPADKSGFIRSWVREPRCASICRGMPRTRRRTTRPFSRFPARQREKGKSCWS